MIKRCLVAELKVDKNCHETSLSVALVTREAVSRVTCINQPKAACPGCVPLDAGIL